jgi:hypothetical protein
MTAYRRFKFAEGPLATVATPATVRAEPARSVATVACVASRAGQTTKLEIPPDSHEVEIEERKGMATDGVPAPYLDAWARLQCQKPMAVSAEKWRQAIDAAGRFLDAWGPSPSNSNGRRASCLMCLAMVKDAG